MFMIPWFINFALSAGMVFAPLQHLQDAPAAAQESPITAIVKVAEASVCALDEQVTSLRFTAEFRVINEGATPLILLRGVPKLYYWRVSPDAASLNGQQWSHYSYADGWGQPRALGAVPDKRFVVLPRGAEHKDTISWALLLVEPLKSPAVWAQVIASASDDWESAIEAKTAAAWRSHGRLWTSGIRSQPFQITINDLPIAKCKGQ